VTLYCGFSIELHVLYFFILINILFSKGVYTTSHVNALLPYEKTATAIASHLVLPHAKAMIVIASRALLPYAKTVNVIANRALLPYAKTVNVITNRALLQ
jgi:uncharacterized membrane protein YccF (DUF307 family)